ncbi:MAG: hypothetical protein IT529_15005 [Burkholderiales bacterium]|nr:hypothetical protein [Burkholderiales bacterium]
MKTLIASLIALVALSGCVAVPYAAAPAPGGYYYAAPVPATTVHFGYTYRGGPRHGHRPWY